MARRNPFGSSSLDEVVGLCAAASSAGRGARVAPGASTVSHLAAPCYGWRVLKSSLAAALRASVVACALGVAGCPSASAPLEPSLEPDAVRALELYRDALVGGRPKDAFALIHPDAREGLDEARFVALYERHKDALVEQAERVVAKARKERPVERAQVHTDMGPVELERTPDGWRLRDPVGERAP